MPHAALLGDSVFDNGVYTSGEPDVVTHLRTLLPEGWSASLMAVDGATIRDVPSQLARLSTETTHIFLSVGGNDALLNSDVLTVRVASTAEAMRVLGERVALFERAYRDTIRRVMEQRRRLTICTVYNGNLEGEWGYAARLALTLFNDVILRVGVEHAVDVIDLRFVCDDPRDYANPIEPSGVGGRKIAQAIGRALFDAGAKHSRVFGGAADVP